MSRTTPLFFATVKSTHWWLVTKFIRFQIIKLSRPIWDMIKTILFLLLSASKSKNWISYGQVKIVSRTTPPHFISLLIFIYLWRRILTAGCDTNLEPSYTYHLPAAHSWGKSNHASQLSQTLSHVEGWVDEIIDAHRWKAHSPSRMMCWGGKVHHSCFKNIYSSISTFHIISVVIMVVVILAIDDINKEIGRNERIDGKESDGMSLLVIVFIRPWTRSKHTIDTTLFRIPGSNAGSTR